MNTNREKMIYFIAESAVIVMIISLCVGLSEYLFIDSNYNPVIVLFLIPFFMIIYTLFRYIFSGMEYSEVVTKAHYKQRRKEKFVQSIVSGGLFFILYNILKGLPDHSSEWYNRIGMSILFTVFLFLIYYISLKRSYKKNKELAD